MANIKTATGTVTDAVFSALTHLQGCRDAEALAHTATDEAAQVAFDSVQGLGYLPSPESDGAKRQNKEIVKSFRDCTGIGFSASVRLFKSLDKDNFTDYHRDIVKRHKALPRIVTTEARIVKVLD